ncbi:MAG: hypothetical protein WAX07_09175 [Candidatus Altiarchaeia archaeon]|jgi:hypothetical protein
MDSAETWFGGMFRRPGLRGSIYLGLSVILILWVALFLQGDIWLRLILGALIAIAAIGFVFFNWGSVIFWNGYKPFVFYLVAKGQEDTEVKEALSLFDDPGVKVSVVELPRDESIEFFLHRIKIYKKDMSAMASSGKIVPAHLLESYEDCSKLLRSVKESGGHVLVLSVVFDTSRISQQNASQMVRKAKDIGFI